MKRKTVKVRRDTYVSRDALEAAETPTSKAIKTNISAIVVALVTIAAETTAINANDESIRTIAIAMT